MAERKLIGENLQYEEKLELAQLTRQPGWKVLVKLMAEACRNATEEVIRLDPSIDRYIERVAALQTTARAINKFSAEVLDSVKVHQNVGMAEYEQRDKARRDGEDTPLTRFTGFKPPVKPKPKESPAVEGQ